MTKKLPADAFQCYVGLGPSRSYEAVAERFGVSKRSVTKLAAREEWQTRIQSIEEKARESLDKKAQESLEAVAERHLKSLRVIQGKALEALKSMRLSTAMEAVRALDIAIKQERVIRGEPSERSAVSIEETIKKEYASWLSVDDDDGGDADVDNDENQ